MASRPSCASTPWIDGNISSHSHAPAAILNHRPPLGTFQHDDLAGPDALDQVFRDDLADQNLVGSDLRRIAIGGDSAGEHDDGNARLRGPFNGRHQRLPGARIDDEGVDAVGGQLADLLDLAFDARSSVSDQQFSDGWFALGGQLELLVHARPPGIIDTNERDADAPRLGPGGGSIGFGLGRRRHVVECGRWRSRSIGHARRADMETGREDDPSLWEGPKAQIVQGETRRSRPQGSGRHPDTGERRIDVRRELHILEPDNGQILRHP
jgi:hypothetical protein